MIEAQKSRMERRPRKAGIVTWIRYTVQRPVVYGLTHKRRAGFAQVDTHLMCATGFKAALNHCKT